MTDTNNESNVEVIMACISCGKQLNAYKHRWFTAKGESFYPVCGPKCSKVYLESLLKVEGKQEEES